MLRGILARNTRAITQTHIHTPRTTHPYSQLAFLFSPRGLKQREGVLTEKLHTHFNGGSNAVTMRISQNNIYFSRVWKRIWFLLLFWIKSVEQWNNNEDDQVTLRLSSSTNKRDTVKDSKSERRLCLCANGACHLTASANQRLAQIFDLMFDHFDWHTMMNDY
jgi:hypothetical protein